MAARQAAKINAVPPASSGSNDSFMTTRSVADPAPTAAAKAEQAQNRAASNFG